MGISSLPQPLLVAIAKDGYLTPTYSFADLEHMPLIAAPKYGQDLTFAKGRKAPNKQSVGTDSKVLKEKMRALLRIFAAGDTKAMASKLFEQFLKDDNNTVKYFTNEDLNSASDKHENIKYFCDAALSAPNLRNKSEGKNRIHQALKKANWDITKMYQILDLGVPAFDIGSKLWSTEDFNNGLGLMVNGVQYVYVIATDYTYDKKNEKYTISLKYLFYDVFGLDDDDLNEYGAPSDSFRSSTAAKGITAWWQLQFQFNHAPLVTRIELDRTYECPAK